MTLDSKALPILAALLVLLAAGAFLLGQYLMNPDAGEVVRPAAGTADAGLEAAAPGPEIVRAIEAMRAGRLDESREMFESVPRTDRGYLIALAHLGLIHEAQGQPEQAVRTFDELLSREPENADAHLGRSRALYNLGRYDLAEYAALRTLELDPEQVAARYQIGLIRVAQGAIEEAINSYLRAMDRSSDESRVLAALQDLAKLESRRPDLADVHYALAFFANSLGSTEQEVAELERYLEMSPDGSAAEQARVQLEVARSALGG
jgi:tetratricopeptide (TPR) repeat protein